MKNTFTIMLNVEKLFKKPVFKHLVHGKAVDPQKMGRCIRKGFHGYDSDDFAAHDRDAVSLRLRQN